MQLFNVRGKNLKRIGWESGILQAHFVKSVYEYSGVPMEVRDKLLRSPYPDKLFSQIVRGKYPSKQISGPTPKGQPEDLEMELPF